MMALISPITVIIKCMREIHMLNNKMLKSNKRTLAFAAKDVQPKCNSQAHKIHNSKGRQFKLTHSDKHRDTITQAT